MFLILDHYNLCHGIVLSSLLHTIAFTEIVRVVVRADISQAIRNIRRSGCNLVDQTRLHINTDAYLIAVPMFIPALTTKTRLFVCGHFPAVLLLNGHL